MPRVRRPFPRFASRPRLPRYVAARLAPGALGVVPALSSACRLAVVALGLVLGLAVGAPAAVAHDEPPASTTTLTAGPYPLTVALYADPPRAGQELSVLISPNSGAAAAPDRVRLVARPGLGVDSIPTRAVLTPDPDGPGAFAGAIRLPAMGPWLVDVLADGPAGPGAATLPVTAAAPGALPIQLGWAFGLSPLLGVVWFAWWQHGYLRRLELAG
ncbi:MAG TPA: hypothetical protein VII06_41995 [Chloroflexota bacterium]|jgi:hypothetical protein